MTNATTERNPATDLDWKRTTPRSSETATTRYRGLFLMVNEYGWNINGASWEGYNVGASASYYAPDRPSLEENMAAAIVAADDLLAKGWTVR